jgi:hypothetical protein
MLEQQDRQRLLAHRVAQNRSLTPQERLSQLERKLVEVLHEVQALRSQMEAGQHERTLVNPAEARPK